MNSFHLQKFYSIVKFILSFALIKCIFWILLETKLGLPVD